MRSSNRGALQLKHGANQPANRWYQQGLRAVMAWAHLCRPCGGRRRGIWFTRWSKGLKTSDDQPRATTARLQANQLPVVITWRDHAHHGDESFMAALTRAYA